VGSALSPAIAARFRDSFGVGISESYGATETGPVALAAPELSALAGCLGKPYSGVEVQVWDSSGAPLGPGETGEIVVKSPATASEYLGDPEASAGKFKDGFVLTGDGGYLDEAGNLFITGRIRPMVNVAGKKVSPSEVETCLRSHPRVAEALVVAGRGTEGTEWVKALVVPLGKVTAIELREHCAARLAAFKVPREIEFMDDLSAGAMHKPAAAPRDHQ
jgi:acyl-coenzyme A synthetase/AMP-(fatty) acid ligase